MRFLRKRHILYGLALVASVAVLVVGTFSGGPGVRAAGTGTMYITPAGGSYTVGATFTVSLRENSNSDQVNAVQADLTYPASLLQYISTDTGSSDFGIGASSSGGGGAVSISRGSTTPLSGDKLIATVTFKALAAGSAAVSWAPSSVVLSSADNSNVVATRSGGTYSLTSPAPPAPAPPAPAPSTPSTSKPKAPTSSTSTVAPQGNSQAVPLPGASEVQLNAPATVQTTTPSGQTVTKVEYYLGDKLVKTVTSEPFTYTVDTTKLRNGKYKLATKTYYTSGKTDTSTSTLDVKNPWSWSQVWLQVKHYWWLAALLAIVVIDVMWTLLSKRWHGKWRPPGSGGFSKLKDAFVGDMGKKSPPTSSSAEVEKPADTETLRNDSVKHGQVIKPQKVSVKTDQDESTHIGVVVTPKSPEDKPHRIS